MKGKLIEIMLTNYFTREQHMEYDNMAAVGILGVFTAVSTSHGIEGCVEG